MGAALKKQEADFDKVYGNISKLYDHAEDILKIAYHDSILDKDKFIKEVDELVGQIEESANIISKNFGFLIESGSEPTPEMRSRVTGALRNLLFTIEDYRNRISLSQN